MVFKFRPTQALKSIQNHQLKLLIEIQCLFSLSNPKPLNSRLSGFMKNSRVEDAQNLFDKMPEKNTITWNAMIRGYFQNGIADKAISLYNQMPVRDIYSYNTMISGLMQFGDIKGAEEVFECMGERDVVTWNSMISGYVNNDMVDVAFGVFNATPVKDVVTWNLVIAGLVKVREIELAEHLFRKIPAPDVASWTIIIKGLLNVGQIVEAREYFDNMPVRDVQAWDTMIAGYLENGYVEIAEGLFHKMPGKDQSSWNEIISGLLSVGRSNDAMKLFGEMPQKHGRVFNLILLGFIMNGYVREAHAFIEKHCITDVVSWTNMIIGYFELGEVKSATKLFELMPNRDTTAWNATMFGLGENDHIEEGVKLFIRMKEEGLTQDEASFTSILVLCSNMASLNLGKQTHELVIKSRLDGFTSVGNALICMYFRCGSIESASQQFSIMLCRDVISWNSIICGLAHHGNGEKAVELFENMTLTDVKPNQITFVGVLSACSHAGLVAQGRYYFDAMKNKYSLLPTDELYTCMVDLLGRFGLIDEAINILDQMGDDGLEVPASVWGALLGACRMHKNYKVGKVAGERILGLNSSDPSMYMMLAELFQASGQREEAERMWIQMKCKGVKKQPGCSWIESNNRNHIFLAGDRTHPDFCRMSYALELMYWEMDGGILTAEVFSVEEIQIYDLIS